MTKVSSAFYYPPDIKLKSNPLAEAWLEIRWKLQPVLEMSQAGGAPPFKRDPGFPFALGVFYESIKERFGHRQGLLPSQIPSEMVPYVVHHQFRAAENGWPLLQLGPGVATANFSDPYTWDDFRDVVLYLRTKVLNAYAETEIETQSVALRYRNAVSFEYGSSNLLGFLEQNLNTSIALPPHIPGNVSSAPQPSSASIVLTFNLLEPKGVGTLRFATGIRGKGNPGADGEEVLVWQLEVASTDNDAPELTDEDSFADWLESAHAVIHEWFFSLIDGPLRRMYEEEAK
jgi:uncharacterized protein (TIGR04255 family)